MPIVLKLDDNKNVVVIDGKPVYTDDDGKDIEVNVPQLFDKVRDLNAESKTKRLENTDLKKSLKIFEGIDNLEEWKVETDKSLQTLKSIDESKLIQAGKVDELKASMKIAFDEEKETLKKNFNIDKETMTVDLRKKDVTIFDLMVTSKFAQSSLFSGSDPKTILPPEIAAKYFGHQFKVEQDDNGVLSVVGYNLKGTQIYSRRNPGELADFEEAISEIIDEYPLKTKIMRGSQGGSGSRGGGSDAPGNELSLLKEKYKDALSKRNTSLAVALKNKIFELESAS